MKDTQHTHLRHLFLALPLLSLRGLLLSSALFSSLFGCQERESTRAQCEEIFERLIVLELQEMGYHDPALARRWVTRLRSRYRAELSECVGRSLPDDAMTCIHTAKTAEVLSHECLR